MARIKSGILGPVQGRLGPVVGAVWKGVPYLREYTPVNKYAFKSPAQLANQAKFKYVNDWLSPFYPYIEIGFEKLAIGKSATSVVFSLIYNTVFSGAHPDLQIAYDKMVISTGSLPMVLDLQLSYTAADTIDITWDQNAVKGTLYNDQLMLVLYSPELRLADGFVGAVNRANQQHSFRLNPRLVGKPLEAYIGMTSMSRKKISESQYFGTLLPY